MHKSSQVNKEIQKLAASVATLKGRKTQARRRRVQRGRKRDPNKFGSSKSELHLELPTLGVLPSFNNSVFWRVGGKPQQLTDITTNGNLGAIRIYGRSLQNYIQPAASTVVQLLLKPNTLDVNLSSLTSVYGGYAFRKVKLSWLPEITGTVGGQIGFGVSNYLLTDTTYQAPTTLEGVTRFLPSMVTNYALPNSLVYTYSGMAVYDCSSAAFFTETGQAMIWGYKDPLTVNGTAITTGNSIGNLYFDYVLDLYQPSQKTTSPAFVMPDFVAMVENLINMSLDIKLLASLFTKFECDSIRVLLYKLMNAKDSDFLKDRSPFKEVSVSKVSLDDEIRNLAGETSNNINSIVQTPNSILSHNIVKRF